MKKLLAIICLALGLSGCKTAELRTVDYVDLEKYQGTWYEITKIPNRFERNLINVTAKLYS